MIDQDKFKTPILFIIFNRIETTKLVFESIKKIRPEKLYLAADGPRNNNLEEIKKTNEVRNYVISNIDWECQIYKFFNDKNLGCKYGVSGAISWFFENEEKGIILEDDCLPSKSFFWFCDYLLKKYQNENQIMHIAGMTYVEKKNNQENYSYHFCKVGGIWGWATWKRAWKKYEIEMDSYPQAIKVKFSKISSGKYILFILLLIFYKNNIFPSLISSLSIKIFCKKKTLNNQHIFSTLHSYSDDLVYISKIFNLEIVCLQDGLLPSNFTSSYYKYLDKIKLFYVWDNISTKIFSKNDLQYDIWSGFKKKKLPKINHSLKIKIRNILFLTSGSGDWTALKNRSDEDLAYLALKKIAKLFPAIKFVYRPHPLWINPAHQGINSIERLIIDSKKDKVLNFEISDNSLKEASNFQKENNENVSFISKSIEDEIKSADIVLGDHSEALLNAAQQEKIIGSVSLARRKEFFYDYTFLGFPLMRSVDDIAKFIDQVENDTNFCTSYNKIIEKFNQLDN